MTEADLAELMCALRAEIVLAECRALSGDGRIFASNTIEEVCDAYLQLHPRAAEDLERMRTAHRLVIYRLLAKRDGARSDTLGACKALFDARFVPLLRRLMGERTSPGSRRT